MMLLLLGFSWRNPGLLHAELPVARLSTVFPPGGKVGSLVEVSVSGIDLDQATELHFSHSGITGQKLQSGTDKFTVAISSNVPPGVYDTRVVGRFGISNSRAFVVGDLPEATESLTNSTISSAMEVQLGTIINGRAEANSSDCFKFAAQKGQRILIDCDGREIDSRIDPTVVLLSAAGHELQRNRHGSLLDFSAPEDGQYIIKVHDFLSQGGADYFYRLSIGVGPHIDFIFPPSGLPGTKSKYVLYGRNLPGSSPARINGIDGKPLEELSVEIELPADSSSRQRLSTSRQIRPSDVVLDGLEYRLSSDHGVSNPVLLTFATANVVLEQNPNDQPSEAQKVSVPCEIVGQFYPRRDRDWITFEAKKGEVYWIEVFSQRLGLPTDPFLLLQYVKKNEKGEEEAIDLQEVYDNDTNIGGMEFKTANRDPVYRFEVNEDGRYRIQIRDLFNKSQDNPALVYRLSLRNEKPDFRLVAMAQAPPPAIKDSKEIISWSALLRRGGTLPIKVMAFRRDGFNGDIQLSVEGLPSGVSCPAAMIASNATAATLFLVASENGGPWAGPVSIIGKAQIAGVEVAREARGGTVTWTVSDFSAQPVLSRMTRDFAIAISGAETEPISIEAAESKLWETSVAGKLRIPIKLDRRGEFNANLKLKVAGLSALDAMKEVELDGKATNGMLELDLSQNKLAAGNYRFYLQTQTQGKYTRDPAAAKAAEESAKQAGRMAADLAESAKKALENKQAAQKASTDAEVAAKQAAEVLASASKVVEGMEAQIKTLIEKVSGAKAVAAKTPANQELAAAVAAAEKELAEAEEKSKTALEAKSAVEKIATEAAMKAKVATEASAAVEKAESEAAAKAKGAEKAKEEATNRVKETAQKEVTATFYSTPISLKVAPAPITLAVIKPASQLRQGATIEIPITINRFYNYADPVEFNLVLPKEVKGIRAPKMTIPRDQTRGTLVIEAAPDATPGEHKITLNAGLKLNSQDLKVDESFSLIVAASEKTKTE